MIDKMLCLPQGRHRIWNRTRLASTHTGTSFRRAYSLTVRLSKGINLFAAFLLKLPEALVGVRVAFASGSAEQDARLVAVPGHSLAMPVEFGECQLRAGIALLHGNPKESYRLRSVFRRIFPVEQLHGMRILRQTRFLARL